jgi:MFS superfamily sulfate permease-like transporter
MTTRARTIGRDLSAGLVVYLVALPLCLGIALASGAPMASGLLAGVIGGLVVGSLSGSHSSVAGPAAGLTAVVAAQIGQLGSFEAFLVSVVLAGVIQVAMGLGNAGFIAAFFPSSVIKGLLAAIGVILVLKQLPHVLGHDADVEGEMNFQQPDGENSFTELVATVFDIQPGAALIGIASLALLWLWGRVKVLKQSLLPGPLAVVALGVGINELLRARGSAMTLEASHLVQVPGADGHSSMSELLTFPDWSVLSNPSVYVAAFTLAIVASLETLLNLEAVDQIDPQQRTSPPNRELIAQGVANLTAGLLGGLPVTSVIVRGSVNINAGARTRLSTIVHGCLLLISVLAIPDLINRVPLSALAAILIMTGLKLASPELFRQMRAEGRAQFVPFAATVAVIVFTDLLTGVVLGLVIASTFILWSNFRRPLKLVTERHANGEVLRVELANQVSFFSRPSLSKVLHELPAGSHVLLDARNTHYIDPDILDLLVDFRAKVAPAHGVEVSLLGFSHRYPGFEDQILFADHASRELQQRLSPAEVLDFLKAGNLRFQRGEQLSRDFERQRAATAAGQAPLAAVLSCIDSRTPVEHVFDLGLGDAFSVRIAGNVARDKILGSLEYSCHVAGARLIVVMGHTACGAINASVSLKAQGRTALDATGCDHLDAVVEEVQRTIELMPDAHEHIGHPPDPAHVDEVARRNVLRTVQVIRTQSRVLAQGIAEGSLAIVGAMYDLRTGAVEFLPEADVEPASAPRAALAADAAGALS